MWASGEFPEIAAPEDWNGEVNHPNILALLSDQIAKMHQRMCAAILAGRLPAIYQRDFDERIDENLTFIGFPDLCDWLAEFGYQGGDIFEDWSEKDAESRLAMAEHAFYLRTVLANYSRRDNGIFDKVFLANGDIADSATSADLKSVIKRSVLEIQDLRSQLNQLQSKSESKERPLLLRERNTLLAIIGAISYGASFNFSDSNAVSKVERWAQRGGYSISDDTIRKHLKQVPSGTGPSKSG
jgi:hypothetical protein